MAAACDQIKSLLWQLPLKRLRLFYAAVLLLVLLGNLIGNRWQSGQNRELARDAEIINLAGRQRLLSQRMPLLAGRLLEQWGDSANPIAADLRAQLQAESQQFSQAQEVLRREAEYAGLGQILESMRENRQAELELQSATAQLLALAESPAGPLIENQAEELAQRIQTAAASFLPLMEQQVRHYESNSVARVANIITVGSYLQNLTLLVLGVAFVACLEPISRIMNKPLEQISSKVNSLGNCQAMIVYDQDAKVVDVNDRFLLDTHYQRHEVIGCEFEQLLAGQDRTPNCAELWQRLVEGEVQQDEVARVDARGQTCFYESTFIPTFKGLNGQLSEVVEFARDVTENRELQSKLLEVRNTAYRAIEGALVGLWEYDPNTNHVWYSDQLKRLLGFGEDDFETMSPEFSEWVERLHDDDRDRVLNRFGAHLETESEFDVEFRLKNCEGNFVWFRCVGQAEWDAEGNPLRMAGSVTDISGQKKAEASLLAVIEELEQATTVANSMADAAESASLAKSEFLANMSHEIRTPMTAILGFADLLKDDAEVEAEPELRRESIGAIQRNARHLLDLINDILDVSKLEAGKMTLEIVAVSPARVIRDAISVVEPRAKDKDIELRTRVDRNVPEEIYTDPTRLRQILVNLLSNAVKFTNQGHVSLDVVCQPNSRRIDFRVGDTGIGMTPEQLERISKFDAFSQADTSTTRKFGGTGLGLRISNEFAAMLGGKLRAESEYGIGSTFYFSIPLSHPRFDRGMSSPRVQPETRIADSQKQPLAGANILLAEDGVDNQRLIGFLLQKAGAFVDIVENGQQAIDAMCQDSKTYDVILMDMQMPVIDGYTASRKLRQLGKQTPIVALTANAMSSDREKCIESGCNDYVTKPIDRKLLYETVRNQLGNRMPRSPILPATSFPSLPSEIEPC